MPRKKLSDAERKRRERERDRQKKQRKRARANPPSDPPSQEEIDANRENRLRQQRDHVNNKRLRQRMEQSQEDEELIVDNDTNTILQQMSQENHADRRRFVETRAPVPPPVAPRARTPNIPIQEAENHTTAPPARLPLHAPAQEFQTPVNHLLFGQGPRVPAVSDYGYRASMRRNIDRERIQRNIEEQRLAREEEERESHRQAQERYRERQRTAAMAPPQEPTPSVHEILTKIGQGEAKAGDFVPMHEHEDIVQAHHDFHRKLDEYRTTNFFHCQYCKERGPHTREDRNFPGECTVQVAANRGGLDRAVPYRHEMLSNSRNRKGDVQRQCSELAKGDRLTSLLTCGIRRIANLFHRSRGPPKLADTSRQYGGTE